MPTPPRGAKRCRQQYGLASATPDILRHASDFDERYALVAFLRKKMLFSERLLVVRPASLPPRAPEVLSQAQFDATLGAERGLSA